MLKEHTRMIRKLAIVTDLLVVTAAFFMGHALWSAVRHNIYPLNAYLALLPLLLLIWGVLLYHFGIYDSIRVEQIPAILFALFKSAVFAFITFSTFMYLFKMSYVSRAFILFLFILTTLCISLEKGTLIVLLRFIRKKGFNYRRMLIVGTNKRAQDFMKLVILHDEWGLKLVGFIDEEKGKIGTTVGAGYAVLGGLADIPDIIHNNVIDEIIFVIPHSGLDKVQESMHFCEAEGLKIHLAVDYAELKFSKAKQ
ncbi:MAG: sugar transferase, partial [Candidatus Omnitrophica bacterium]|nr:sugar transferase [Candidatus Omnitrophota bacterium]